MGTTYKEGIYCGDAGGKLSAAFTIANGTTAQDLTTADPNGPVRLDLLAVSNDDTVAGVMQILMHDGSTAIPMCMVAIAANSLLNTGANAPVNLLAATNMAPYVGVDAAGNKYLELPQGYKLQANMVAAPSSAKIFRTLARWGKYAAA